MMYRDLIVNNFIVFNKKYDITFGYNPMYF